MVPRDETQLSPHEWAALYRADDGDQQPISAVEQCFGLETQRKRHGLELMRPMLSALGEPQRCYPVIHVTGSKGKGSTAAMIAAILQAWGLRVGLYISPSLTRFEERIQVNGAWIRPERVAWHVARLREVLVREGLPDPKFFEAATAVAFLEFQDAAVDVAVVEVGIGGRRDATNVVHADIAVITTVELEHTAILGRSLAAIASEKAGIIKPGCTVISGVDVGSDADAVVEQTAATHDAMLLRLDRDFCVTDQQLHVRDQKLSLAFHRSVFPTDAIHSVRMALPGCFQARNAALAVAAAQCFLRKRGTVCHEQAVRDGLGNLHWPGRLELTYLDDRPVLLDVAHTPGSVAQLVDHLKRFFLDRRIVVVLGLLRDKPAAAIATLLAEAADQVVVAPVKWYRTADPASVAEAMELLGIPVTTADSIREAVRQALDASAPDGLVAVTGSVFAVGEAKRAFGL